MRRLARSGNGAIWLWWGYLAFAIALFGCSGGITQQQANNADASVVGLCNTAMGLEPIAGPYAIWITAGCGTAELVADLASKPGAVNYLNGIIATVKPK